MRILALSPHTDDAELCAGASIARWLDEGHHVYVYAFSIGDLVKGASFAEFARSMEMLCVAKYDLDNFPAHYFQRQRQKVLETMLGIRDTWKPDLVLCPAMWDCHQDHQVVCNEAVRVFKRHCSIYGYDAVQNEVYGSNLNVFVDVNETHLAIKLAAVYEYRSQITRATSKPEFIMALARVRGVQAGVEYAEAFQLIRGRK